ncbi:MAG: hypothetical protein AMJ94_08590 [Deltaproteobacteria bacterium SM23_61]|nr:MAG: hypothetical protein AMJ94_08590 [Deltaproteobacteria bacterium SM23_61]
MECESPGAEALEIFLFSILGPKKFQGFDFFLDKKGRGVYFYIKLSAEEGVMDRPQIFNNLGWWFYFYYWGGVCPWAGKT